MVANNYFITSVHKCQKESSFGNSLFLKIFKEGAYLTFLVDFQQGPEIWY